jgi:hypothetical protein
MIRGLIYLDENLASSIALRYASHLAELIQLQLQTIHVEAPDRKQHSAGSGWVRRTWEKGLLESGLQKVQRLLNMEKVQCTFSGPAKVFVGDREDEILEELRIGGYDFFLEGSLNTADEADFYDLIGSRLYTKMTCPVMIVKNMLVTDKTLLLCGDGVDHRKLIPQFLKITDKARFDLELLFYKYQENKEPLVLEKSAAGGFLEEAETILNDNGWVPSRSQVLTGTPEQVGDYLRNYGLVVSTFPTRKSPRMETLAHAPSTILLCK